MRSHLRTLLLQVDSVAVDAKGLQLLSGDVLKIGTLRKPNKRYTPLACSMTTIGFRFYGFTPRSVSSGSSTQAEHRSLPRSSKPISSLAKCTSICPSAAYNYSLPILKARARCIRPSTRSKKARRTGFFRREVLAGERQRICDARGAGDEGSEPCKSVHTSSSSQSYNAHLKENIVHFFGTLRDQEDVCKVVTYLHTTMLLKLWQV